MRRIFTFFFATLCVISSNFTSAQTSISVQKYITDTAFTAIAVTANGEVYAGSNGKGMVYYDKLTWRNWNGLFSSISKGYIRQIAVSNDSVWVASSGYVFYLGSGEAGNNINFLGGMHLMGKRNNLAKIYYRGRPVLGQMPNPGPPTRNVLSVAIDAAGKPWCAASYHDSMTFPAFLNYNGRYHFAPGAVGKFNYGINNYDFVTGPALPDPSEILIGVGNNYKDENYSFGKRRTCRAITKVGNEMWVASDGYDQATGNTITAGLLRYDLAGNYLSKYDQNNTGVPFGLTNTSQAPWALYQDAVGRVWAGMNSTRGLAVLDTNGVWTHIGLPAILNNGQVRANAISGNNRGEVFFGTNAGLLMYKGRGSFTSDTSYVLYTMADGLSSNTIQGVAVAEDETIWLATGAGINKVIKGDLIVFNRKPYDFPVTIDANFRSALIKYNSSDAQSTIDKDTLLISADGGNATIFKWSAPSSGNIKFRIAQNILGAAEADQFGSFDYEHVSLDSVRALYSHPKFLDENFTAGTFSGRNVSFQVVDSSQSPPQVLLTFPAKFVLPPVLLVHGVWSSTKSMEMIEKYLVDSTDDHKKFSVLKIWYKTDRHPEPVRSQEFYKNEVPAGISRLIENCAQNKMSVGRVDLVGHSRGAIFARIYLQEKYLKYRKDINKLISLNTPHAGSQTANLALDKRKIRTIKFPYYPLLIPVVDESSVSLSDFFTHFSLEDYDDPNGAEELKVNSPAILYDLNGPGNLNKNKTYAHAFIGRHLFGQSTFADFLNSGFVKGYPSLSLRLSASLLSYTLNSVDSLMTDIYEGEYNDVVVPESSQAGGLAEQYISRFPGINVAHSTKKIGPVPTTRGVTETPAAIQRLAYLLRMNPADGLFTTQGYAPPTLSYNFLKPNPSYLSGTAERNPVFRMAIIDTSIRNQTYTAGDTVNIKITTENIDTLVIKYSGNTLGVYSDLKYGNDTVFRFPIPIEAHGAVDVEVFGFNAGEVVYDSARIFVGIPAAAILDSIKIQHPDINNLKVVLNDSLNLSVVGYYSDGVQRDVTFSSSLGFSYLTNAVTINRPGNVKGIIVGFDEIKAAFAGKFDSTYIEVVRREYFDTVPNIVLPVRFVDIEARYDSKKINVTWKTAMEQNNRYFEVEYSVDGRNFVSIATVTATNYSNGSNYSFVHTNYINGNNYYRIKQVDVDGRFSRSDIAVANVKHSNNITLYPNPVAELLTIDFSKTPQHKARLVRIYNNLGQTLTEQNIAPASSKVVIVTADLPTGVYNIEIIDADNKRVLSEKIIKNR